MKKILITGANSYIGTFLEKKLQQMPEKYTVDTLNMIDPCWMDKDFSSYDAVFHVAGIAHSDTRKVSEEKKRLYYKVNTDLAVETARKAKAEGVTQFIFMSSIIVYGDSGKIGKTKMITKDTIPQPANFYGDTKLKAEKGIIPLADKNFKVAIVRAPMIYGKGCKGNYRILSKYAKRFPLFPNIENQRSVLFIENLIEFIRLIIENDESGIFYPQNSEYLKTSELAQLIAEINGKKLKLLKVFNPFIIFFGKSISMVNKVFGNLCYEMKMSEYKMNYRLYNLCESIERTEQD